MNKTAEPAQDGSSSGLSFWARLSRILGANTIRSRLLVTLVVVVMLTAIITALTSTTLNFQTGQQHAIDSLEGAATLKESQINAWTRNLQTDLALLLTQEDTLRRMRSLLQPTIFREVLEKSLRQNFEQLIELTGRYDNLYLLDLSGKAVLSTDRSYEGADYSWQEYLLSGANQPRVHPIKYNAVSGEVLVVVTQPVYHSNGRLLGVLVGRANLDRLNEILQERTGLGETGETYLIDRTKKLVTPSRFSGFLPGETFINTEGAKLALRQSGSGIYPNYRNQTVVGVYRYIPALQAALLAEQEQAEALRPTYVSLATSLAITVGAVFFSMLIGLFITHRIAAPLNELAGVASQIAAGNLNVTAKAPPLKEIEQLASAFNLMTRRLRNMIDTLEERIYERTRALETSIAISGQLITILDQNELLHYVVNQIQQGFNFYHVHIYLIDEHTNDLVMIEGSGEVGQKLKAKGHRLQMGQGIVGTVAAQNQAVMSNDVDKGTSFVRNPLLPNTKSELAVPLRKGDRVLGVLDIQSEQIERFDYADLSLMQSIANQTAIAIDNIRLLSEMQNALEEVEHLNRRLTGEVWEKAIEEIAPTGYYYQRGIKQPLTPPKKVLLPPMKQAAMKKQFIKQTHPGNGDLPKTEVGIPLTIRGQMIGVLGLKRENSTDWSNDELAILEVVANQVALALENARLSYEQEKTIIQLKDLDRLKSEFLTSMSHELRTPLNSILGFADVLLQGIDGELPPTAIHDIQLIYNSGQHLLALINDVLDLSKIEAGQMELVREPVQVHDTVEEVLTVTRSLLKKKPVKLIVDVDNSLPPIYADRLRFKQILLNLVSNAAKFTEEGEITISAQIDDASPDKIRICVKDTGIGIPRDKLDTVFDRFRQVDSSSTRRYSGTGLGLAISKQLVNLHGGEIGVVSEEGVGSTFYFTIPLATIPEKAGE